MIRRTPRSTRTDTLFPDPTLCLCTYSDTTKKFDPQISGQISWKYPEERLGFLVGATYQERSNRELRGSTETWRWWSDRDADGNILTPATDVNGNPFENDDASSYWRREGVHAQAGTHNSGHSAPQAVNAGVYSLPRRRHGMQETARRRKNTHFNRPT